MGLLEWAEKRSRDEVRELVEGIQSGDIDDDRRERLTELLEETDDTIVEDAIEENGAIDDLLFALEVIPPRQQQRVIPDDNAVNDITPEQQSALDRVQSFLEPTSARGADFYRRLREALNLREPVPNLAITQETIANIPEEEFADLIDRADEMAEAQAAASMRLEDFPQVEDVISRRSGRTAAYFENILEELQTGDPDDAEKLRDLGVDQDRIQLLFRSQPSLEAAIEQVQDNISALESGRASTGNGKEISPTGSSTVENIAYDSAVKRVVPGRVRRDWLDDEEWMADPEQVRLEQNFMEWVFRTFDQSKRWDTSDFNLKPKNRDISMQRWAVLQVRGGHADPEKGIEAGLPPEWFEDLG
jgi:hypothetical protein